MTRARRELALTGVQSAAAVLLKSSVDALGYVKVAAHAQVPLIADRIVEPASPFSIDMMEALPAEEASFYAHEANVVAMTERSPSLFREIEQQYGFVGGSKEQYIKYLARDDCKPLWVWGLMSTVKAIAGISTVPKKDNIGLRKILMQCAANYAFTDVRTRSCLGMMGGSALARAFVPSDDIAVSALDEDSAFTYIRVPQWLRLWCGGPPLLASEVWALLPPSLQAVINLPCSTYVSPTYTRLAMGSAHAVHIIMQINLHSIGQTLLNYSRALRRGPASSLAMPSSSEREDGLDPSALEQFSVDLLDELESVSDSAWVDRQTHRRKSPIQAAAYTVESWCEAVRAVRHGSQRTMVGTHFFAGERRPQDVREVVESSCQSHGISVLMLSSDLIHDACWDLTIPATFHSIMMLCTEGLIDVVIGGPPCSTVSRVRFRELVGGPRPVRFRSCPWGRPDLYPGELLRVKEANILWLNFLAICEAVSLRGGGHLVEHPLDPNQEPFPSFWITPETLEMEVRTNAVRAHCHQCAFEGITPKPTCLSGTLDGLDELNEVWCPGVSDKHWHGRSTGRAPDGSFYSRALQRYPPGFCRAVAERIVRTFTRLLKSKSGPTGTLQVAQKHSRRITSWSKFGDPGVVMLNECASRGQSVIVDKEQAATHIHVDDCLLFSASHAKLVHADQLLDTVVEGLEQTGFSVSQQTRSSDLTKVVGYEIERKPARLALPAKKMALLRSALLQLVSVDFVEVDLLASLVGVWVFGSLVNRNLLCVPHAVFGFMDTYRSTKVKWTVTVREEVRAMAHSVGFMCVHLGAKFATTAFATDAMGASSIDAGGYGIVGTTVTPQEIRAFLSVGELPGYSVARVSDIGGAKHPSRGLSPTVPFSLLPAGLLNEDRWSPIGWGRFQFEEHITLQECRTVVKLCRMLSAHASGHDSVVFSLQDNRPTSGSISKGRSPSFGLNRLLRMKSAVCIAARLRLFLPWIESARMPADWLSRIF